MNTLKSRIENILCFLIILFQFTACDWKEEVVIPLPKKTVFLSVSLNNEPTGLRTTLKSGRSSVNEDQTLFEDRVKSLSLYIFNSDNKKKVKSETIPHISLNDPITFTVVLTEGDYDFYFIANVPGSANLPDTEAADEYMLALKPMNETLFSGASEAMGFPMSRVYRRQRIAVTTSGSEGSSEDQPIHFQPVNEAGQKETHVFLDRRIAKLEVILTGLGASQVTSIHLINGVKEYTLLSRKDLTGITPNTTMNELQTKTNQPAYLLYTPEVIHPNSSSLSWSDQYAGQEINYLLLEMRSGKKHKVPIVSNYQSGTYLEFAASASAEFDVRSNNHYRYTINLKEDAKEIHLTADIVPWERVGSSIGYGEAEAEFELTDPTFEAGGERTVLLHQQQAIKVRFKLKKPQGALWRASITNGLDFSITPLGEGELSPGEVGGIGGIAHESTYYVFYVKPLKPYTGTNRYTELYITVNGDEIQLMPNGGDPGPGKRYVFKQVE